MKRSRGPNRPPGIFGTDSAWLLASDKHRNQPSQVLGMTWLLPASEKTIYSQAA
jgi:hypothetical protein